MRICILLQCLYMEGNELTLLPEDFFDCLPNLQWLDLRQNYLSSIPSTYIGLWTIDVLVSKSRLFNLFIMVVIVVPSYNDCQSIYLRWKLLYSAHDNFKTILFSGRHRCLRNLLLEGNDLKTLPLELGKYFIQWH